MSDDLGIRLGNERVSLSHQLLLEGKVVLHDSVVHHYDASCAVAMGMRILFRGAAMRGPARVANSVGAVHRLLTDDFFEIAQLARGAAQLQAIVAAGHGNARGVVAAVFEAPQSIEDDLDHIPLAAYVADDSAHAAIVRAEMLRFVRCLLFQAEAVLFNHGICQYVARNAVDFRLRRVAAGAIGESEQEILPLADIGNGAKLQFFQSPLNGLALGIEHRAFQCDVDMCLHRA